MNLKLTAILVLLLLAPAYAYTSASKFLNQPAEWYATDDAKRMADNILTWQSQDGTWPKNTETAGV